MSSKPLTPQQNFEERVKDKLRDAIPDLITDDEIQAMVTKSLEDLFFKKRIVPGPGWNNDKEIPPLLHEITAELLGPAVDKAVKEYIESNKEAVNKAIEEAMGLGMGKALMQAVTFYFSGELSNLKYNIDQRLSTDI